MHKKDRHFSPESKGRGGDQGDLRLAVGLGGESTQIQLSGCDRRVLTGDPFAPAVMVALLPEVCSHLLGRLLSEGWAHPPPSCGSYRSKAILGSNILAVFHVISPA